MVLISFFHLLISMLRPFSFFNSMSRMKSSLAVLWAWYISVRNLAISSWSSFPSWFKSAFLMQ